MKRNVHNNSKEAIFFVTDITGTYRSCYTTNPFHFASLREQLQVFLPEQLSHFHRVLNQGTVSIPQL